MAFSKTFPKQIEGSNYPRWEEVYLSYDEEIESAENARKDNLKIMRECIKDAKALMADVGFKDEQADVIELAKALFDKRASHEIYWKENKAKEKFDSNNAKQQLSQS